ncbi:hypothetical protein BX070DRAFT_231892 [Coemansia spiralis]|nr:hypothetical protein BX070DRAFT_231892 [Coemansia spiralis]
MSYAARKNANTIAFDPTQGAIAVGYASGAIRLFSKKLPTSLQLNTERRSDIAHMTFIPGQPILAAIDKLGTLWIFDVDSLNLCFSYQVPIAPTSIGLIAGTNWLLIGTEAGRLYFVNAAEGKKSDFSIGCQIRPPSSVVSADAHPVETEKILIAYAEGTCVICDLGKASASERAMVLGRYKFEHPHTLKREAASFERHQAYEEAASGFLEGQPSPKAAAYSHHAIEPSLTSAGWSPTGTMIVTGYDNGTLCIFETISGAAPIIAQTIFHSEINAVTDRWNTDRDANQPTQYIGQVRWCTLANTDQSFILVTSGHTKSSQRSVYTLDAGQLPSLVRKDTNNIPIRGSYELEGAVQSICMLPQTSPWKGGNEGICGLTMLIHQRRNVVQALAVGADMQLHKLTALPGELVWCSSQPILTHQAKNKVDSMLGNMLLEDHARKIAVPASQGYYYKGDGTSIEQLLCTVDNSTNLKLWYNSSKQVDLALCEGLGLDIVYITRLLGIDLLNVSAIDLNASNGLMAIGMNAGETILCVLTDNPRLSIAQRTTSLDEIRNLALEFYNDREEWLAEQSNETNRTDNGQIMDASSAVDGITREQTSMDGGSSASNQLQAPNKLQKPKSSQENNIIFDTPPPRAHMRDRAASTHDGHSFLRRNSKRLSTSIGSIFRRGSSILDSSGANANPLSDPANSKHASTAGRLLRSGIHSMRISSIGDESSLLPRPSDIDDSIWERNCSMLNTELSQMLYGLRFSETDILRICKGNGRTPHQNMDQSSPSTFVLPFMLARFYASKVTSVVSGQNGIVAIAFEGGVVVAVDCVKQTVVLADNINRTPTPGDQAKSLFRLVVPSSAKTHAAVRPADITVVSILNIYNSAAEESSSITNANKATETIVIGTSLGYVLVYEIENSKPPAVMTVRDGANDSILLLNTADPLPKDITDHSAKLDKLDQQQNMEQPLLVIGSPSSITTHIGWNSKPAASYNFQESRYHFIAANTVTLSSGWHGVLGVTDQWRIIMLMLPELEEVAVMNFANAINITSATADGSVPTASDVQISSTGHITATGSNGVMVQASVTDAAESALTRYQTKQTFFDIKLEPPPLPARKGITSWLFGKSANAACDIDAFLGSHARDLLKKGGVRPGERFRTKQEQQTSEEATPPLPSGRIPRSDSKVEEIDKSLDRGMLGEMRMLAEQRGQHLEEIGENTQRMSMQSKSFLDNIRAYNAKQERDRKKRFGLF